MSPPSYVAHLWVDGYNVIGAWPNLQQSRDQDGLEMARGELIEALANYSAFQGFETNLVFDAYGQATPAVQETVTQHLNVHYTGFGQTADSYIERVCAQHHRAAGLNQRLIVATSDRAQQLTVMGYGAEWMSAHQLALEVRASFQSIRQRQRQKQRPAKRSLMHTLDQNAREKLTRLRFGLK